jgi:pimeloyl-ACP methyl ester carboxylesterase
LGRSSRFWLGFEHNLRQRAEVVLVDLCGTGMSPSKLGRWSVASHSQDVQQTLDSLGLPAFHLVAISFGAMVAIDLAGVLAPRCVSGTFVAPSSRFTKEQRIRPRALVALAQSLRHRRPRHEGFAHHLVSEAYLKEHPEIVQIWDALYDTEPFSRLAALGQIAAAAQFGSRESLERLSMPTFFVVSKNDGLVSWRNTVVMSQVPPKATLHVYEGPGHDLPTEVGDDLAARILDFCGSAENPTGI